MVTTRKSQLGILRTEKGIETATREIREWLTRPEIGVNGLSINVSYDPSQNVAMLTFNYKGKSYEKVSTKQMNCRLNVCALAQFCENKARAHVQGIEDFDMSISPYVMIGSSKPSYASRAPGPVNYQAYAELGIEYTASNEQLKAKYRDLIKAYHPDMINNITSAEAKKAFSDKLQKINESWALIKTERDIA